MKRTWQNWTYCSTQVQGQICSPHLLVFTSPFFNKYDIQWSREHKHTDSVANRSMIGHVEFFLWPHLLPWGNCRPFEKQTKKRCCSTNYQLCRSKYAEHKEWSVVLATRQFCLRFPEYKKVLLAERQMFTCFKWDPVNRTRWTRHVICVSALWLRFRTFYWFRTFHFRSIRWCSTAIGSGPLDSHVLL